MNIWSNLFLNLMHIAFPIFIYLVYICYKKSYNQRENNLGIVLTIFSVLYIIFKFNNLIFAGIPFAIVNLALIIAFLKNSNVGIIIASIISVIYYYLFYQNYLIIFILLYVFYYFIYLKVKDLFKINIIVNSMHAFVIAIITFIKVPGNYFVHLYQVIFASFISYLIINLVIYIIKEAEVLLKLHMSNKELEHDKQIKNSLFQITHEIKNPIAVCKGYLDMFDVNNQEHAKKYIPIMKEEISRTLYLLEDFLAMNKIKIKKDILDINLLLEEVSTHFLPIFKEKNINLKSNVTDDEIYIDGDYNRLSQVFLNVFKNSIEAIGETGQIELWTEIKNNKIYIKIKDNGCGISKKDIGHIKEAFYTTKVRGTGLGVSLSNEIILAHSGQLLYDSKEGNYTLVTVILPLKKAV